MKVHTFSGVQNKIGKPCSFFEKCRRSWDAPGHNSETSLPPVNDFCVVSQDLGHFSKKAARLPYFVLCSGERVHFHRMQVYGMVKKLSRRQGMANERQNQDVSQVAGKQHGHASQSYTQQR